MSKMIYTWGYRGRTVDDLRAAIKSVGGGVLILDVRRRNSGARIARGWSRHNLQHEANPRLNYWPKHELGNFGKEHGWTRGPEAEKALLFEADLDIPNRKLLLLCAEPDAQECHRSEVAEALAEMVRARGRSCEVVHL